MAIMASEDQRKRLLRQMIDSLAKWQTYYPLAVVEPQILAAVAALPRADFVPHSYRHSAYDDASLPIESGQRITQPSLVALMTQLMATHPGARVLEIGGGSGYQTAALSRLVAAVYTVEQDELLAWTAVARLKEMGCRNVALRWGDGSDGWAQHAPYDAIVVTAACEWIPSTLVNQLSPGGRLVMPLYVEAAARTVGPPDGRDPPQWLVRVEKLRSGGLREDPVMPVRFVPLVAAPRVVPDGTIAASRLTRAS